MKLLLTLALILGVAFSNAEEIILTKRNHCALEDQVNFDTIQALKFCLADRVLQRRGRDYKIYLVINSPGGSIYDGLKFIEFAKTIDNLETVSIFAASMGSAIVEGLPGKRHVTETGILMFHRAAGSFKGQFEDGEVEKILAFWKKIVRKMETVNSNRIGITLDDYKSRVKDEWWLYGDDNVNEKTADQVSIVKCAPELLINKHTEKVATIFGEFEVVTSECPLLN